MLPRFHITPFFADRINNCLGCQILGAARVYPEDPPGWEACPRPVHSEEVRFERGWDGAGQRREKVDPSGLRDGLQRRLKQAHWSPLEGTVNKTFSNLFLVYLGHRLDRGTCQKIFGGLYFKRPTWSLAQVWPLTQFFLFPFCKNSLICMKGKSMTPHRGNTIFFRSSQQLPRLRRGPS